MLVDSFKKENNELVAQFNLLLTEVSLCQKATFLNFIICKSNPGYAKVTQDMVLLLSGSYKNKELIQREIQQN